MIDLTSSPGKLKTSILNEAMQGKLTKQLPDDGNAIDLLEQINNEKKQLIANKKIKNSKKLPDITSKEIPFHIPNTWKWVRLNNIGVWKSGSTPKRNHPEYYNGEIPWLKTGDLNDNYVTKTSEKITQNGLDNSNLKLNPVGSVLIAMYGATIGKLGILNIESTTNQACCACEPSKFINNKFLFYYLMSQKQQLISLGSGGAQPNISRKKIINYLMPLPPFKEQNRIVKKLDFVLPKVQEVNVLVNQLQDLRNKFPKRLKVSLLKDAMQGKLTQQLLKDGNAIDLLKQIDGKKQQLIKNKQIKKQKKLTNITNEEIPFKIPNNWQWVRLGNISTIQTGNTPAKSNLDFYNSKDIPFVKPGDLNNDYIKSYNYFLSNKAYNHSRIANKNSILTIGIGNPGGKVSITTEKVAFNQQIHCLSPICINYKFMYYLMQSSVIQKQFSNTNGTAVSIVNKTKLSNFIAPLPPLLEQKRIANKLDHLFDNY